MSKHKPCTYLATLSLSDGVTGYVGFFADSPALARDHAEHIARDVGARRVRDVKRLPNLNPDTLGRIRRDDGNG